MASFLEELALNAWPAPRVMLFDGWVIRFADGQTRRANSVSILGPSAIPIAEKVAYCESVYRAANQKAIFKIPPVPDAESLDSFLERRGYEKQGLTDVMTIELAPSSPPLECFRMDSDLTERWLSAACELNEIDDRRRPYLEAILRHIQPSHGFASLEITSRIGALGLAVVERGWMGIYDIATAKDVRRLGHARNLVVQMMEWGYRSGVRNSFLHVIPENVPAVNLYRQLGFESTYQYWYRVQPSEQ